MDMVRIVNESRKFALQYPTKYATTIWHPLLEGPLQRLPAMGALSVDSVLASYQIVGTGNQKRRVFQWKLNFWKGCSFMKIKFDKEGRNKGGKNSESKNFSSHKTFRCNTMYYVQVFSSLCSDFFLGTAKETFVMLVKSSFSCLFVNRNNWLSS